MSYPHHHPFRSPQAKAEFLSAYDARARQWPIPSTTQTIETSYGSTFVRISGPETGQPMVLLHGHSENALNWLPNIAELSQDYRTYALDIISDPGRSVYTQVMKNEADFVAWLDEVCVGLELTDGVNLVGLSYGGWIVSHYALQFPQKVLKLVLLAPAGFSRFSLKFIILALFLSLFQFRIKALFRYLTRWMFTDFLNSSNQGEAAFNAWFNFIYLGLQNHQAPPIVFAKILSDEQLIQLTMPTLFLTGEHEIVFSVDRVIRRLQTVAPQIQTQVIANSGHDLPLAHPQTVNQAILTFLAGAPA
ncbi:MAG: alpha/beta hydrolase [Spirulina sp. SIO3F2]|nr:alpha/beta hydrolase [Spirulina sp. SIO3F2]